MDASQIWNILNDVAAGEMTPDQAAECLEQTAVSDLGFARVDLSRNRRCGMPEVIFCEGKTAGQVAEIARSLHVQGQSVFGTRATPDQAAAVKKALPDAIYHELGRIIQLEGPEKPTPQGLVVVAAAGTADLPVAEEARLTLEHMGAKVETAYDVGVAGLHRVLPYLESLRKCNAIVCAAGMEGALPSVIGGLVDRPLIAVPTSVGYGMNLEGVSTLLAMLNSCVAGISVVNVDNGFGAAVAAAFINRRAVQPG